MAGREMAVARYKIVIKEIEMKKHRRHMSLLIALIILVPGMIKGIRCAAEEFNMQGWGINDVYNKYYDLTKFEKIRAWVVGFKTEPPLPGMSPGTIMIVRHGRRLIDVHICPTWFAKPADVGVKKGDRVKIKGSRAEIGGKEVFMASKLKKENYFEFKVRLTSSGKPFWTMTPEELVSEKLSENE
jgi:hypothetical protein